MSYCRIYSRLALTGAFLVIAMAVSGVESVKPEADILSRDIAIEDVCAWPKLTLLPNGELAAAVYNQASHGRLPGDVECWVSADEGRTWEHRGTATQHEPGMARYNHAIGVAGDGALLIIAGGWTDPAGPGKGELLRPVVSRSTDGGRTWTEVSELPDAPNGMTVVPFGDIAATDEGDLLVTAYTYADQPRVATCYLMRSEDGGRTWSLNAVIGPEISETDIVHLGDGHWLAAGRALYEPERGIDVYRSEDDGLNWRLLARGVTGADKHPGHLLELADGRVLLTYGDRSRTPRGVGVRLSEDQGESWSEPVLIVDGLGQDAGYPSTAQLEDGTLVTVYYASSSDHDGFDAYHMGVTRWTLDGD